MHLNEANEEYMKCVIHLNYKARGENQKGIRDMGTKNDHSLI